MKEIKLQFWNRKSKTMSVPYSLADLAYEGFPNQYKNEHEDVLDEECDVLQYTGLKDKNGKEIYEGDIVRAIAEVAFAEHSIISDVIYSESTAFSIRARKEYNHGLSMSWGGWESFEVIGNIYENPNLLQIFYKIQQKE